MLSILFCLVSRASCSPDCPRTQYVAEACLQLLILMPVPPDRWDYKCPSSPVS